MWKTTPGSRPKTELALADLAEISVSSVPLEDIMDIRHLLKQKKRKQKMGRTNYNIR